MEHTYSCANCGVLREAEIEPMQEATDKTNELKTKKLCPVCSYPFVKSVNSMTPEERKKYIEKNSILEQAAKSSNEKDKSVQNSLSNEEAEIQAQNDGERSRFEAEQEALEKDKYEMERGPEE